MQMNPTPMRPSQPYLLENKTQSTLKKLSRYSRMELTKLKDKNLQMLSNQSVIDTLPDKGAKLRETNQIIDNLLIDGSTVSAFDEITVGNTSDLDCPLTKKLEEMSVLTPHQGARKRSVDLANQQAFNHYTSSGLLTNKPKRNHSSSSAVGSCPSMFYSNYQQFHRRPNNLSHTMCTNDQSKVKMLTLDESMTLQTEQRSSVIKSDAQENFDQPSRSLLNSLNLSIDVIQDVDTDQYELPEDEEEEYYTNQDVEPMVVD